MLSEEHSAATLDSPKKESERPTFDLEEAKRVLAAMALTAVKGLFKSFMEEPQYEIVRSLICHICLIKSRPIYRLTLCFSFIDNIRMQISLK